MSFQFDVKAKVSTTDISEWKPHPGPQTLALMRVEFELLYGGARGGGKTEDGLAWIVEPNYIHNPRYRGLVIRRNAEDLGDWVLRARSFYYSLGARFAGKPPVIKFPSGAVIRTGHLKDENAYGKYIGHEYQKILLEELTQIPRLLDYLKLIASCRSVIPGLPARVFATTNPGGPGHLWVKERWVDVAKLKVYKDPESGRTRIFIPAKVEDNPTLMKYDPSYVAFLEGLPTDLRRAWRHGDWDSFEGQFFDRMRREIHVVDPFAIPEGWSRAVALDWGFSPHPFSVGWYAKDWNDNAVKYREKVGLDTSPYNLAQLMLDYTGDEVIDIWIGDTQMWVKNPFSKQLEGDDAYTDKSIAIQLQGEGIPLEMANKDRVNGWVLMKSMMQWKGEKNKQGIYIFDKEHPDYREGDFGPRLKYFSTCPISINSIFAQIHDEKKPGDMLKQKGDDTPDTDRYALMHMYEGEAPTKDPTPMEIYQDQEEKSRIIMAEEQPKSVGDMDA